MIELCQDCKGRGYITKGQVTSNKGDRSYTHPTCETCKGSGRMIVDVEIKRMPFDPTVPKDHCD